jgi:hypothetical protein
MHLSSEIAADFVEGRLAKEEHDFWTRHVEACAACTADIRQWRQLGQDLKRSHLRSAPEELLDKVNDTFQDRREEHPSGRRSAVARLIFDSFQQPAFAGARGATVAARQLVMRAEEFDIHIKIWGEPDHRQMLGQMLPRGGDEFVRIARFHLLRNGERIESAGVDETGEFHFTDVPEGDLSLQIDLPNLTVIGALNVKGN